MEGGSERRPLDTGCGELNAWVAGSIGWMEFDNPARHNALTGSTYVAIERVAAVFADDPAVRAVAMTGAGSKAFVSGADISEQREASLREDGQAARWELSQAAFRSLAALRKPLVAMINGYCLGGGLHLALQADLRVASDTSVFGIPAARLGIGYGRDGVRSLLTTVGPAWTAEILFTARRVDSGTALRIGLVNHVVPAAALRDHVAALMGDIASNAPLSIVAAKAAIAAELEEPADRDGARVDELIAECARSVDVVEGRQAFLEKRPPRFEGR